MTKVAVSFHGSPEVKVNHGCYTALPWLSTLETFCARTGGGGFPWDKLAKLVPQLEKDASTALPWESHGHLRTVQGKLRRSSGASSPFSARPRTPARPSISPLTSTSPLTSANPRTSGSSRTPVSPLASVSLVPISPAHSAPPLPASPSTARSSLARSANGDSQVKPQLRQQKSSQSAASSHSAKSRPRSSGFHIFHSTQGTRDSASGR